MMRFLFVMLLTAIASYFALMIMPWWIPMLIAFCVILILPMRSWLSFMATAIGSALCHLLLCVTTDQANDHILSRKMAALFQMPSYIFMIVATILAGFISAGLGGWTAAALRHLLQPRKLKQEEFVSEQSPS